MSIVQKPGTFNPNESPTFTSLNDVLVGWAALRERVQLVHFVEISPQSTEVS